MTTGAVKITRKGQATIPKAIREKLKANIVYFEVADDGVIVRPVRDAVGSLKEYAKRRKPGVSMERMRDEAWEVAVRLFAKASAAGDHLLNYDSDLQRLLRRS